MPLNTTEKQFESDIAAALLSPAGGYTRNGDCYDPKLGLFVDTLIHFVQKTQPNEWAFFEKQNPVNPVRKFCTAFNNACDADGLLSVLRYGFKHRGRHSKCTVRTLGSNVTIQMVGSVFVLYCEIPTRQ